MSLDHRFKSDKQWFVSPLVDLSQFLRQAANSLILLRQTSGLISSSEYDIPIKDEEGNVVDHNSEMASILHNITGCQQDLALHVLEKDLRMSALRPEPEEDVEEGLEFDLGDEAPDSFEATNRLPSTSTLRTVEERNVQAENPQRKNNYQQDLKYYRHDFAVPLSRPFLSTIHTPTSTDLVISCSLALPNNKVVTSEERRNCKLLKPAIKLLLRGDLPLLNFRRKIICPCDMTVDIKTGEWLEKPDLSKSHMELYPSSFLFIHDTFYVDLTKDGSIDISEPVREFMAKHPGTFDKCKVADITQFKVKDLKLRLGQPYVFVHNGECEHLLQFHDLRLLSPQDEQDTEKYPLVAYEKGGEIYCYACKKLYAAMVVEDCDMLPYSPAFLCDTCFKEYLFEADGSPVCPFKANHYYSVTKLY